MANRGQFPAKYTETEVMGTLSKGGMKLIGKYENSTKPIDVICKCGRPKKFRFCDYYIGKGCRRCGPVKLTLEQAREEVSNLGLKPLFNVYDGAKKPIKVECCCGNIFHPCLSNIRGGAKCRECGYKHRKERTIPYDVVADYYKENGCTLLLSRDKYKKSSDYMPFLCSCGKIGRTNFYNFKSGVRCKSCATAKNSGELNWNYNPNLTPEERERNRYDQKLRHWSLAVKQRDNFTCVFCGDGKGGNLMSHHLDSYSSFPDKRYDVNNGVTFCMICHKDFHDMYGYGGNTRDQFEELTKRFSVEWCL